MANAWVILRRVTEYDPYRAQQPFFKNTEWEEGSPCPKRQKLHMLLFLLFDIFKQGHVY